MDLSLIKSDDKLHLTERFLSEGASSNSQNYHRSMAMCDLYGKSQSSVAVTTTVGRVKEQLSKDTRLVFMPKVEYVDWCVRSRSEKNQRVRV